MRYLIFILIVFVTACRVTPPQVVTNTIVRDTTITIPPDSAWLVALIECDSNYKAHLRDVLNYNQGANIEVPTLTITNNVVRVVAKHDTIKTIVTKVLTSKVRIHVEVRNELTTFQRVMYWAGLAWSVVLVLFILFIFLKRRYL